MKGRTQTLWYRSLDWNVRETPAWQWLNLWGLDAPLIALVWQDYLSRHYSSELLPAGRAVLALTVWAIYLTDRLLDSRHTAPQRETARHRFCRDHRGLVKVLLFLILCADMIVAFVWVRPVVLEHGFFVMAGVVIYFALFPVTRRGAAAWKKPVAAFLFTAGVFVSASFVSWTAVAFFVLCLSNLLMIESWEHGREVKRGWLWMAVLSVCCAGWFWPVSASAAGLALLSLGEISTDARCVLADVVLLSPVLFR